MNRRKLSNEILWFLGVAFAIAFFLFQFLTLTAKSIVWNYQEVKNIYFTEYETLTMNSWIQNISLLTAVTVFVILFLFLVGQKIAYLNSIIKGVEALRTHRMDFEMPLEGNNELTELAESINYLAVTERQIRQKERALSEEKEQFIRTLSHDIRTPLTSILSYSEYLGNKEDSSVQEMKTYTALIQKKAEQIKELTDILLDGGQRNLEMIEEGRLLMAQLVEEWEETLENDFTCVVDLVGCPKFSGEFDIQELRRIFDNLSSNIKKYADADRAVELKIGVEDKHLVIEQKNAQRVDKENSGNVESYRMGLNSIKRIAQNYGGGMEVQMDDGMFEIKIIISEVL